MLADLELKSMNTLSQANSRTQNVFSDQEFHRCYTAGRIRNDIALQLFAMGGVPPRARSALLAVNIILRRGEKRTISHAALAARLDRDVSTAGRYLDALVKFQEESGYQFVSIERCSRLEKKPATFCDNWEGLLYDALRDAYRAGEPLDVWVKGQGANQPGLLAREAIARKVLEQIPRKEVVAPPELSPEEQAHKHREQVRRKLSQIENRTKNIFSDLDEFGKVLPFAAIAEHDRIKALFPQLSTKTDRRLTDYAFAERFPNRPPEEDQRGEERGWLTCQQNDLEIDEPTCAVLCETHKMAIDSEGLSVGSVKIPTEPDWLRELADEDSYEADPRNNWWEPPTDAERLEAALVYAARGRRIVPVYGVREEGGCWCRKPDCRSIGKHPRITNWQVLATTSASQIRAWFEEWPKSNVGWAMGGPEGFLTLDFDGETGERVYQELKRSGLLPPTLEQQTGSGWRQVIFRGAPNLKNEVGLVPGLDIRSQGGQVLIPPSISGKGPYFWRSQLTDPVPIPRPLLEWIQGKFLDIEEKKLVEESSRRSQYREGTSATDASLPLAIPEGQRNNTLFRWASGLRSSDRSLEEILSRLQAVNSERCDPPLDDSELAQIAASAYRRRVTPDYWSGNP